MVRQNSRGDNSPLSDHMSEGTTSRKSGLKAVAREKKGASVKKKPIPRIPRKTSKSKGTFPNKSHPKTGPTVQAIIEALLRTGGMMSKAARILNCDVKTITNRMKECPEIEKALAEAEDRRLDEAETMLDRNIGKGDQRAIEFFLSKKGKARGYGADLKEKDDVTDLGTVIDLFEKALEEEKPPGFPNRSVLEVAPTE